MTAAISGCGKAISIIRHFQLSGRPLEQRGPDNRGCTVLAFRVYFLNSNIQYLINEAINTQFIGRGVLFLICCLIGKHIIILMTAYPCSYPQVLMMLLLKFH